MLNQPASPLLSMRQVSKSYPGIKALDNVSLDVHPGEVVAIIGENGAGKSTLIKMLGGAHRPDSGQILIDGEEVGLDTPVKSAAAGIAVIYQEFNLVPFLSARENLFLGNARHHFGVIDVRQERRITAELLEKLGATLDPDVLVSELSIAEKQLVEIAKSLACNARLVVMDEPTATLTPSEVNQLFGVIAELKAAGIGLIYISHRLDEVLEIADRLIVLRDGQRIQERRIQDTHRREMIELMVGRSIENEFPKQPCEVGPVRLQVKHLRWGHQVDDVSFQAFGGEVLGITGLVGAGRTEVARLLSGAETPDSGTIHIDGTPVQFRSPREGIDAGVCLLSEDRKGQGLVLQHSVQDNFGLPNLDRFSRAGVIDRNLESAAFQKFVDSLGIRISNPRQAASELSGGNQQKLVIAKWLQRDCRIVIIDEPTRGIDVGAKYEIYLLLNQLTAQGKAVIMISSEIPEVLGMADRILVMRQGKISGEIAHPREASQAQVMELAAQ